MVAGYSSKKIICTDFCEGRIHDFSLFKTSKLPLNKNQRIIVDRGYQGIYKYHKNTLIPNKISKKVELNKLDKIYNLAVSKYRIYIEHIFACLKKFKILSTKFRNRKFRFKRIFNLITGIYNALLINQ